MNERIIRIGTRSSELAMWQAKLVQSQLETLNVKSQIIKIDSKGDKVLDKPLYELGIVGVFTRNLDVAMLDGKIDIAVHSLKDVPTVLPEGIVQAAVLERASHNDIIVYKNNLEFMAKKHAVIATGSLRRKAQWLNRYPEHTVVGLRGNVNTRLKKLEESNWDGAIFAAAGLQRIKKTPRNNAGLSWMIPAPAQGVIMITALAKDTEVLETIQQLNDKETEICVGIEREFLNTLEGGCTAPIGALAYINEEEITFKGVLVSTDGKRKIEVSRIAKTSEYKDLGKRCAKEVLIKGGQKILLQEGLKETFDHKIYATKAISKKQIDLLSDNIKVSYGDFIRIKSNRLKPEVAKKTRKHVVFTSQNAVQSILENFTVADLQFENIYCVGRRTKKLIESKIAKVAHSENSALKLAEYLVNKVPDNEEITFFCGDSRRDVLPDLLTKNNKSLTEIEVYTTQQNPIKLTDNFAAVLFFSPSAIKSYLSVENTTDVMAVCIGETTAKEAKRHFKQVQTAKMPTVENVIQLVNDTLK